MRTLTVYSIDQFITKAINTVALICVLSTFKTRNKILLKLNSKITRIQQSLIKTSPFDDAYQQLMCAYCVSDIITECLISHSIFPCAKSHYTSCP